MAAASPHGPVPGRLPALAVVLAALAISTTGGAAPGPADAAPDAPPHHSCSLLVVGRGNGSADLADLQLECSPPPPGDGSGAPAALAPPLTVAVNESLVPRRFVDGFKGVRVVSKLDCRQAIANPTNDDPPRFPLLFFCGDYDVRFDRPVIRDVWLPTPMEPDDPGVPKNTRTGVLLFGGGVRAVLSGADISDNAVSAVVLAVGPGSSVRIEASTVARNRGWSGTGVLALNGCHVEISGGSAFVDNTAGGRGAAVVAGGNGTTLAISGGSVFAGNTANNGGGGAVVVTEGAKASITSSSFTSNQAINAYGGAVSANGNSTTLAISNGTAFIRNSASDGGGAVDMYNGASASITSSSFTGNQATNGSGGAVSAFGNGTTLSISDGSAFANNTSNGWNGGAVLVVEGAKASITSSNFTGNHAINASGGAVAVAGLGTTLIISSASAFANNTGSGVGGAVTLFAGANVSITSSFFTGNKALNASGGAVSAGGNGTTLAISEGSVFLNNTAREGGGVLLLDEAKASISNSSFKGNRAGWGGAVLASGNGTTLTINGNSSCAENSAWGARGWFINDVVMSAGANASIANASCSTAKEQDNTTCSIGTGVKNELEWFRDDAPPRGPRSSWRMTASGSPRCESCTTFHFSLEKGGNCTPCSASAYCPGAAVIAAQDSFWQGNGTEGCRHCELDNIIRCPNPKACTHSAKELALQHKHSDSYGPLFLLRGPTDYNPATYSQQLCTASPPAYTGVLCGACRKPLYGQTAPFTCKACLGVDEGRDKDTVNSAGIIALFSTYSLCFVAFVLFTAGTTLMENAESRDDVSSHSSGGGGGNSLGSKAVDVALRRSGSSSASSTSSIGNQVDSRMHTMHVIKALVMYVQYARIIINLPISWWPDPLRKAAETMSSAGDDKLTTQYWSWLLGWPASLDCLFAAANLAGRLGTNQAGAKGLINLLAPLALFAAATACQAAWWVARQRVGGLLSRAAVVRFVPVWAKEWLRRASERLGKQVGLLEYLRQHAVVTALVTIFWWYPTIAGVAMGSFTCVSVCPVGRDASCVFWAMDMTQACPLHDVRSPSFGWALGVGVPAWLVCVAVPVLIVALLSRAAEEGRLEEGGFIERFGFLYLDYRFGGCDRPPHLPRWLRSGCSACWRPCIGNGCAACCHGGGPSSKGAAAGAAGGSATAVGGSWSDLGEWVKRRLALVWNAVIHFQTLLLVALSTYGALMHEYYQTLCVAAMLGCYLVLVVWLRPFRALAIQRLQALLLAVLCGTTVCIQLLIRPPGLDEREVGGLSHAQEAIKWVLLLVNVVFVLFALALLVVCLARMVRELRKQQARRLRRLKAFQPRQQPAGQLAA